MEEFKCEMIVFFSWTAETQPWNWTLCENLWRKFQISQTNVTKRVFHISWNVKIPFLNSKSQFEIGVASALCCFILILLLERIESIFNHPVESSNEFILLQCFVLFSILCAWNVYANKHHSEYKEELRWIKDTSCQMTKSTVKIEFQEMHWIALFTHHHWNKTETFIDPLVLSLFISHQCMIYVFFIERKNQHLHLKWMSRCNYQAYRHNWYWRTSNVQVTYLLCDYWNLLLVYKQLQAFGVACHKSITFTFLERYNDNDNNNDMTRIFPIETFPIDEIDEVIWILVLNTCLHRSHSFVIHEEKNRIQSC